MAHDDNKWRSKRLFGLVCEVTSDFDCWEAAVSITRQHDLEDLYKAISCDETAGNILVTSEFGRTYVMRYGDNKVLALSERAKDAYLRGLKKMIEFNRKDPIDIQDREGFDELSLPEKVKAILGSDPRGYDDED